MARGFAMLQDGELDTGRFTGLDGLWHGIDGDGCPSSRKCR
ncbi:MAG: hypothetical protein M5U34_28895 [Chloroflexi bacterium]|nr:hypothetical protein [Chloroflexota bacterium]